MLCYDVCVCVFLSAGSLEIPFPWLIAQNRLLTSTAITTTIVIIIIIDTLTVIQLPRILGHLQLEVPRKLNELLMLLQGRLNGKIVLGQGLRDARKVKEE